MKNKKTLWLAFCTLAIMQACSATNVTLSMEKDTYSVGERVPIMLNVIPTGAIGGQLMIYQRVNNTYVFVKKVYSKPSPAQCSSCSGFAHDTPLREPLNETFYFIATKPGIYNADANFDGVKDSKNFTILETTTTTLTVKTTTTTTVGVPQSGASYGTTTTSTTEQKTTTTTAATTTTTTETSTTTLETTVTLAEKTGNQDKTILNTPILTLILLVIAIIAAIIILKK